MNSSQRMPRQYAQATPVQNSNWTRILLAIAIITALASLPSLIPRLNGSSQTAHQPIQARLP